MSTGRTPDLGENSQQKPEPVLDVLALTEDTAVGVTRLPEGKFKVTSKSWDTEKVVLPDQVLELRMIGGRVRIARKARHPDSGDMPSPVERIGAEGEIAEFE
ncbi:MAG: hypothetical protein ACLPKT_21590 [Methylocella sp.]